MTSSEDPKGNPSDKAKLLAVHSLSGPFEQKVKVQYYADGSIRFRVLDAGPMALTSSFLSGKDKDVVLQVASLKDKKIQNETLNQLALNNAPSPVISRGKFKDHILKVLLNEDGEIECSFHSGDGSLIKAGKLSFKPDLAGEPHAQISVPCPGGWEFIEDEKQEVQHVAAKQTQSAWIGQKIRVFDDGTPLYVTIDAIVCTCCGEVNSTPWEVQQELSRHPATRPVGLLAFSKNHNPENITKLVLSDSTYILAPDYGAGTGLVDKICRVNDLFEKDRWNTQGCLETRYNTSFKPDYRLDGNINKHYREWADLFCSPETKDTSQLIQKHLGKAPNKNIGKGTAKRGTPADKSEILNQSKINVINGGGHQYAAEITSVEEGYITLSDGTFIFSPDEENQVIYRAIRTEENSGIALRYIEARCPGQNNYQEWAALFPDQEIEIKATNPDGKAVVWSNKDKRIEGKQG